MERREAEQAARLTADLRSGSDARRDLSGLPVGLLRAGNSTADLIRAELELERQSTFHDPAIIDVDRLCRFQRHSRQRSFPTPILKRITCARFCRGRIPQLIVNSCRYRKPKALGLHKEFLRQTGLKACQILHIGDNRLADFEAPRGLGMAAIWRPRAPEDFRKAMELEFSPHRPNAPTYFPGSGDAGLSAVRAQAVDTPENWSDPMRSWGALFLGPVWRVLENGWWNAARRKISPPCCA